jgi:3D (Asp-Asp-Asp) domain-containing protein
MRQREKRKRIAALVITSTAVVTLSLSLTIVANKVTTIQDQLQKSNVKAATLLRKTHQMQKENSINQKKLISLKTEINKKDEQINILNKNIENIKKDNESLKQENNSLSSRVINTKTFEVTAYTNYAESTGKNPGDASFGITASGERTIQGRTLSCPKQYPSGTKMLIEDIGVRVCTDTGSAITGNRLDLYVNNLNDAIHFGRKKLKVEILEEV